MIGNFRADSGNGAVYVFNRDASGGIKVESKLCRPDRSRHGTAALQLSGAAAAIARSSAR